MPVDPRSEATELRQRRARAQVELREANEAAHGARRALKGLEEQATALHDSAWTRRSRRLRWGGRTVLALLAGLIGILEGRISGVGGGLFLFAWCLCGAFVVTIWTEALLRVPYSLTLRLLPRLRPAKVRALDRPLAEARDEVAARSLRAEEAEAVAGQLERRLREALLQLPEAGGHLSLAEVGGDLSLTGPGGALSTPDERGGGE